MYIITCTHHVHVCVKQGAVCGVSVCVCVCVCVCVLGILPSQCIQLVCIVYVCVKV